MTLSPMAHLHAGALHAIGISVVALRALCLYTIEATHTCSEYLKEPLNLLVFHR
jgi:hypothetical protein